MKGKIKFGFQGKVWRFKGTAGWFFVSLPESISSEIRTHLKWQEEGWGRMPVTARTGQTEWETAIWFDTKQNTYLLPLKTEIRKKEKLELDETFHFEAWL